MRWHRFFIWIMEEKTVSGSRIFTAEIKIWKPIEFFKHLNSVVLGRNHGAMMIAEESTAWPKVTGKPEEDGLGFDSKMEHGMDERFPGIYEIRSVFPQMES